MGILRIDLRAPIDRRIVGRCAALIFSHSGLAGGEISSIVARLSETGYMDEPA